MIEQIANQIPSDAGPTCTSDSGNTASRRLHKTAQEAVTHLFPKERGLLLLNLLMQDASVQSASSGTEQGDFVIVRLESIERFAREAPGWSKDTMLRYLSVLEALQLTRRHRTASSTELYIPLGPWVASEQMLAALDALLVEEAARAKLQQLARSVKERFLLLYGTPSSYFSLLDEAIATLSDVEALLATRLCAKKRGLVQLRVAHLKIRLETDAGRGDLRNGGSFVGQGDLPTFESQEPAGGFAREGDLRNGAGLRNGGGIAREGDLHASQGSRLAPHLAQKGDFGGHSGQRNGASCAREGDLHASQGSRFAPHLAQRGDFGRQVREPSGASLAEQGDLCAAQASETAPTSTKRGDFGRQAREPSGASLTEQGDLHSGGSLQNAPHLAQKGDFESQSGRVIAKEGDFEQPRPDASLNDNDNSIINDKTLRDDDIDIDAADRYSPKEAGQVGRSLALFLERSPKNTGGFVVKCKECSRTVIRAAVIDVLVHQTFPTADPTDLRGRPRFPAKWFHDACKRYAADSTAIPPFVMRWVKTDLSWQEIADQLHEAEIRYQRYMIEGSIEADLVRAFLRGGMEQSVLDEQLQAAGSRGESAQTKQAQAATPTHATAPHPNVAEKSWMDEYEAQALSDEILRDASVWGVSSAVPRAEHGVYVVALRWRGSPMTMKTPQQWRTHFAAVLPLFEKQKKRQQQKETGKE